MKDVITEKLAEDAIFYATSAASLLIPAAALVYMRRNCNSGVNHAAAVGAAFGIFSACMTIHDRGYPVALDKGKTRTEQKRETMLNNGLFAANVTLWSGAIAGFAKIGLDVIGNHAFGRSQ